MKHTKHLLVLWAALLLGAGNAWGATGTVSITSFSTTSGDIGSGFTYSTYKGNATSAPAVNSSAIRLYQGTTTNAGGLLVVKAPSGYTITAVAIKSTMATTVGYVEGVEFTTGQKQSTMKANGKSAAISANGIFTASGLSCDVITFACLGTSSSSRLYLASITVTYESGSTGTTLYSVQFDAGSNGTCGTTELTEASAGAGVTLPDCTPNEGYTFIGWATTDGSSTADAGKTGDNYKPTDNCTLYAVYKASTITTYTVNFYVEMTILYF